MQGKLSTLAETFSQIYTRISPPFKDPLSIKRVLDPLIINWSVGNVSSILVSEIIRISIFPTTSVKRGSILF